MTAAWIFIAACWIGGLALYAYALTKVREPLIGIGISLLVPVLMIGSVWVPDLWL